MDDIVKTFSKISTGADETAEPGDGSSQRRGDAQPADESGTFQGSVTCKDEDNREVDWFILYKTPNTKAMTGLDYVYIYPDRKNNNKATSRRSTKPINAADGILANTLRPLLTDPLPPNVGFISYNDQPPKDQPPKDQPPEDQPPEDQPPVDQPPEDQLPDDQPPEDQPPEDQPPEDQPPDDQPPEDQAVEGYSASSSSQAAGSSGPTASFGHSKGVVMVEKNKKGVWLLHSTPQFPYSRDPKTFWPKSGATNAQIFICVTFNYDQFEHIGKHLQKIRAFPFDHDHLQTLNLKTLKDVTTKNTKVHDTPQKKCKNPPKFQQLTSSGGKKFHSIAKLVSAQPEVGDLYVSISNEVHSDVNFQTWGGQQGRDGSYRPTNGYNVQNILSVKPHSKFQKWGANVDHSKWCVAVNKPWTCIADVNRSESQYGRLGGALCVEDEEIAKIFRSFVVEVEECKAPDTDAMKDLNTDK